MATTYQEHQAVRIVAPQRGEDVFERTLIHDLPAGQIGTIVMVHGGGQAFDVEFVLGQAGDDGYIADPDYTLLTLEPHQIVPA